MKRHASMDELRETAALYALGGLSQSEARAFELHLKEGCPECDGELRSFQEVTASVSLSVSEAEPSHSVRQRLIESVTAGPDARKAVRLPQELLTVRSAKMEWTELCEGILVKEFYVDPANGQRTSLVRMSPGTSLPGHRHGGVEQLFILEGDCRIDDKVLGPGDYHCAAAGSIHERTDTETGTTFLLIAPNEYEFFR